VSVLEAIQSDTKAAMKAGDREVVGTLRVLASELQKAAKDRSAEELAVLQRERKRRLEAAQAYRDAGREDLAGQEEREAGIVERYLPSQLSDEELGALVADAIAELAAGAPGDIGKVMGVVMPRVAGRADGKRVSAAVRERLAS
jgi:uncharacterized protein